MAKKAEYVSKAVTTTIAATSRASVKINESFYTVEYHEERTIPDLPNVDLVKEREALWETCNNECDNQIITIVETYKK